MLKQGFPNGIGIKLCPLSSCPVTAPSIALAATAAESSGCLLSPPFASSCPYPGEGRGSLGTHGAASGWGSMWAHSATVVGITQAYREMGASTRRVVHGPVACRGVACVVCSPCWCGLWGMWLPAACKLDSPALKHFEFWAMRSCQIQIPWIVWALKEMKALLWLWVLELFADCIGCRELKELNDGLEWRNRGFQDNTSWVGLQELWRRGIKFKATWRNYRRYLKWVRLNLKRLSTKYLGREQSKAQI